MNEWVKQMNIWDRIDCRVYGAARDSAGQCVQSIACVAMYVTGGNMYMAAVEHERARASAGAALTILASKESPRAIRNEEHLADQITQLIVAAECRGAAKADGEPTRTHSKRVQKATKELKRLLGVS